jgi:RNA methyltransferase, TrmH family
MTPPPEAPRERRSSPRSGMLSPQELLAQKQGWGGPTKPPELKLCGLQACLAVFRHRPDDIVRLYLQKERLADLGPVMAWCAKARKAYHIVTAEDLNKLTQSTHHEGVCFLIREAPVLGWPAWLAREREATGPRVALLLESVGNPHNLGAIVRVAAHFGVTGVLLTGRRDAMPTLSAAVHRTAEGGLENVDVVRIGSQDTALTSLREIGYTLVATSSHAKDSLYAFTPPERVVYLFGAEAEGLTAALAKACDRQLAIPGTGVVESLNVACATAVALAEYRRLHPLAQAGQA